jgi:hypothetical protein
MAIYYILHMTSPRGKKKVPTASTICLLRSLQYCTYVNEFNQVVQKYKVEITKIASLTTLVIL